MLAGVIASQGIGCAITHAYEGGHPDHDAVACAASASCRLLARGGYAVSLYEMPLYRQGANRELRQTFALDELEAELALSLDADAQVRKRRMLACYTTQRHTLSGFAIEPERFRPMPRHDFTVLPNGGALLYEHHDWGVRTGAEWKGLAAKALIELDLVERATRRSPAHASHVAMRCKRCSRRTISMSFMCMGSDFAEYLPPPNFPVLATLHLPVEWYPPRALRPARPATWLNCVSQTQHEDCPPSSSLIDPIANGVTIDDRPFAEKGRYALVLGRICRSSQSASVPSGGAGALRRALRCPLPRLRRAPERMRCRKSGRRRPVPGALCGAWCRFSREHRDPRGQSNTGQSFSTSPQRSQQIPPPRLCAWPG